MPKHKLARISITVPELTVDALDQKIVDQHYESRSQAIVDMINKHLIADQEQRNAVMVGTSQRNAVWHLLRGNVLKSLVRDLPHAVRVWICN